MVRRVGVLGATVLLVGCGLSVTTTTDSSDGPLPALTDESADVGTPGPSDTRSADAEPRQIDDIVMIGDSITVGSTPQLQAAFAEIGFDDVLIVSQNGKRIDRNANGNPSGTSVARFLTSEPSDRSNELWVIALGTNDVNQYVEEELRAAVAEMLAAVPDEAPLVWVDTYFGLQPDGASLVNATVAQLLAERGNATIARWSAVADGDGILRDDGVHLREPGNELFAKTVVDTAAAFIDG